MKKTLRIDGLDCANCAAKVERGIAALEGVTSCSLSFLTGKLVIEAEEHLMDGVLEAMRKVVRKLEPDAVVR